jgi:hypothetical protein
MPLGSGPLLQPAVTTAIFVVPLNQKLAPVQPAKRVTATTRDDGSELDPDEKRRLRHADHSCDRGTTLDVDV